MGKTARSAQEHDDRLDYSENGELILATDMHFTVSGNFDGRDFVIEGFAEDRKILHAMAEAFGDHQDFTDVVMMRRKNVITKVETF